MGTQDKKYKVLTKEKCYSKKKEIMSERSLILSRLISLLRYIGNRSQVQGSTFRVKDEEAINGAKSSLKCSFFQIIAN